MELKRGLGLLDVFAIAAGAMISSGLFVLPGIAYGFAGPAMIISYFIAGILVIPTVMSKAELVTAMPRSGGDYFYITRSMGFAAGTIAGFASWFSLALKSAFALLGLGIVGLLINPGFSMLDIKLIAVALCLVFMLINLVGIKEAGITQILLVAFLVGILVIYIVRGFVSIHPDQYTPFAPNGWWPVLSTAGLVFISFGGLTKVASVAEEIRNPKFVVPVGMILAYVTVLLLYLGVIFITVGVLPHSLLQTSLTPISEGARSFWGTTGVVITAIGAVLAFVSTANAGIMSASRYPLAMSRDHILPVLMRKINKRFKTPHIAIIFTTAFMIMIILFLDLHMLVEAASTMLLLLFISANLSVIVMRESKLQSYQPTFRAPLYPYLQIAAIIGYGFLVFDMGITTLIITGIFIAFTVLWFFVYVKPKIVRDSAIMYIVERITDKQIVTDHLREELREIVKEREEIIEDEFDRIIKDAIIIDIPEKIHFDEFIKIAAQNIQQRLGVEEKILLNLFVEREKQSCTALRPGLAIPHIIIDGEQTFDIVMVRAEQGITFPDAPEPVHIVFILVGTRDMRNLHLRALMAIAQLCQHPDFDTRWVSAKKTEDLRDIILLGKRKRN
jgi:amino acid transporter/mannitol/fructose-specific phosphotransferase system IIA component